jgi:hypothetical protein
MSENQSWKDLTFTDKKNMLVSDKENFLKPLAEAYNTTISTLKQEKKILDSTPTYSGEGQPEGKELGGTDAQFFQMQAKAISYEDAICEIIDGILENHSRRGDTSKKTTVKFNLLLGGTRLDIEENSGGIARDKFQSVATLGGSGWGQTPAEFSIGVFGVGLKKALRKIGKNHHLFTWFDGGADKNKDDSQPCEIEFNEAYWNGVGEKKTQAFVTTDNIMLKKKGFTIIQINDLERYEDQELSFTNDFIRKIGRYYGQVIKNIPGEVEISFQEGTEDPIVMDCKDLFSDEIIRKRFGYFPGFEPRSFVSKFKGMENPDGTRKDVTVTVKFGITRDNSEGTAGVSGVYVYGNDRFFYGPEKDPKGTSFGFGTESKWGDSIKELNHITYGFRAKVDVVADWARDIPWNIGEKNGYDTTNPTHQHIAKMLQFAALYYFKFIEKTKAHHRSPFTINGVDMLSGDDWKKCFFPDNWEEPTFATDSKCKASMKFLEDWVPRTKLLDDPVDINKLGALSETFGSWIPQDMLDIKDLVAKKQEPIEYDDHDWIRHLCEAHEVKLDPEDEKKISKIEKKIKTEEIQVSTDKDDLLALKQKTQGKERKVRQIEDKIKSGPGKNPSKYNKLLAKLKILTEEYDSSLEAQKKLDTKIKTAQESHSNKKENIHKMKSKAKSETVSIGTKKSIKNVKKIKPKKDSMKVQGYVPSFIIKEMEDETSLIKHDSHFTRYLLAHYLLTKDEYDESKMPNLSSQQLGTKELGEWWKKQKKKK